jgi:hypothetical protein
MLDLSFTEAVHGQEQQGRVLEREFNIQVAGRHPKEVALLRCHHGANRFASQDGAGNEAQQADQRGGCRECDFHWLTGR